jgi:hypothetical protein
MWQGWIICILGLWTAASPFTGMDVPSVRINNVFIGGIIITIAWTYLQTDKFWLMDKNEWRTIYGAT